MSDDKPLLDGESVLNIQISKSSGYLHATSQFILRTAGLELVQARPTRARQSWVFTSQHGKVDVLMGEQMDACSDVSGGITDLAIVSWDALQRWRSTQREICGPPMDEVACLGPSGCALMVLIPEENMGDNWVELATTGQVVTAYEHVFRAFLTEQGADDLAKVRFVHRKGGNEPRVREMIKRTNRPVLAVDTVATGKSAFAENLIPAIPIRESAIVLIRSPLSHSRAVEAFCQAVQANLGVIRQETARRYIENMETVSRDESEIPAVRRFTAQRALAVRESYRHIL